MTTLQPPHRLVSSLVSQSPTQVSFRGSGFVGGLPTSWGAMLQLKALDLSFNNLSGPIPDAWAPNLALTDIVLDNNVMM